MKVVIVEPLTSARIADIEESLDAYQRIVGGYIECVYPFTDACIVCNEEGKMRGLTLNRELTDSNGNIVDIISGTFFIVGLGEDDFKSLTDEQAESYRAMYAEPKMFVKKGTRIVAVPVPVIGGK